MFIIFALLAVFEMNLEDTARPSSRVKFDEGVGEYLQTLTTHSSQVKSICIAQFNTRLFRVLYIDNKNSFLECRYV